MTATPSLVFPQLHPQDATPVRPDPDKTGQNADISRIEPDADRTDQDKNPSQPTLECPEMSGFVRNSQEIQLSRRQVQALPYLVSAPTLAEAARRAQITDRTLRRWLHDDEFRQEFERLRRAANEISRAEISGLSLKAALVVGEALDDPNSSIRLRAALAALALSQKANEIADLQQQLDQIANSLPLYGDRRATSY